MPSGVPSTPSRTSIRKQRRRSHRRLRLGFASVASVATIGSLLAGVSGSSATTDPSYKTPAQLDAWYAPPANLAILSNGDIIRSRENDINVSGFQSKSWQLLYKSTDAKGQPVADSTTVLIPPTAWTGSGRRPLVSYQAAEDSVGANCAPGFALAGGTNAGIAGDAPGISQVLQRGWAAAVPDYEGPESQFIVGPQAGHAVLDGLRAAQHFTTAGLSSQTPTALWGYSGGGNATAWAGELAASYAPDLKLAGIAEGGVPADLQMLVNLIDGGPFAGFDFVGVLGLWRAYPEMVIDKVVNAQGKALLDANENSCLTSILLQGAFKKLDDLTIRPGMINEPIYQQVLALNKLGQRKPNAPVFNYGAMFDEIVPTQGNDNIVAAYCKMGATVYKERYLFAEHATGLLWGFYGSLNFLSDRFAAKPAPSNC